MSKNLVVGIGNTLLCDDGIGPILCREAALGLPGFARSRTDFRENNSIGLDLLFDLLGYDRVLLIDSLMTENERPGRMLEFDSDALKAGASPCFFHTHGFSLGALFAWADVMGVALPAEIILIAVTIPPCSVFGETLSGALREALPGIAQRLRERIAGWNSCRPAAGSPGRAGGNDE